MNALAELWSVLHNIRSGAKADFSGLGVLMYSSLEGIPAFPLRRLPPRTRGQSLAEILLDLTAYSNPHHDGFHLMDTRLVLTHTSQYLAPPINRSVRLPESQLVGARYVTALFASMLPSVVATASINSAGSISVFQNGQVLNEVTE